MLITFLRVSIQSEVADCRKEQPFEIIPESSRSRSRNTINFTDTDGEVDIDVDGRESALPNAGESNRSTVSDVPMDTDSNNPMVGTVAQFKKSMTQDKQVMCPVAKPSLPIFCLSLLLILCFGLKIG
jgi:hypothetical protein